jgi:DNA-binding FadR family transcriptional regulator
LRDVIEFRVLIEPRAAAQAATRGNASDIAAIRDAFEAFRNSPPGEPGHQTADEVLHTRIVIASGNQFFQQMAAIIRGALSALKPLVDLPHSAWEETVRLHSRVVEAIERHDAKEAETASIALIDFSMSRLSGAMPDAAA